MSSPPSNNQDNIPLWRRRGSSGAESASARAAALSSSRRRSSDNNNPIRNRQDHATNALPRNTITAVIKREAVTPCSGPSVGIANVKFLASYNWVRSQEATIYVPGTPAAWCPPALPFQVPNDGDSDNPRENRELITAPRWSTFFAAMIIMQPGYPLADIDIVAERGSLRGLFNFACGAKEQDWRIDAHIVEGKTIFLSRWVRSDGKHIQQVRDPGYGFGFEKACLKFDDQVKDSSSHIRIVQYQLGDLKCVVQGEADGYLEEEEKFEKTLETGGIDDVLQRLEQQLSLHDQKFPNGLPRANPKDPERKLDMPDIPPWETDMKLQFERLHVIRKGRLVSSDLVMEAKCSSSDVTMEKQEKTAFRQCWLAQTRHLRAGQHVGGLINEMKEYDLSLKFGEWENNAENQGGLRKLMTLLKKVKEITLLNTVSGRSYVVFDHKKPDELGFLRAADQHGLNISNGVKNVFWPCPHLNN